MPETSAADERRIRLRYAGTCCVCDAALPAKAEARDQLPDPVSVHGVLCFVEADWPLVGGSFTTRTVQALSPKKLYPKLTSEGPMDVETIAALHTTLVTALPPA